MTSTPFLTRARRTSGGVATLGLLALLATACGTRLSNDAFQVVQVDGSGQAAVAGGAGPGVGQAVAPDSGGAGLPGAAGSGSGGSGAAGSGAAGSGSGGPAQQQAGTGAAPAGGSTTGLPPSGPTAGGSAANPRSGTGGGTGQAAPERLTASDVGVTPSTIRVGLVVSASGPVGSTAFTPGMYGVKSYFGQLNARGGIHGRKVELLVCDDRQSGEGNSACVRSLINDSKVFAFVGNTVLNYAGAPYVSSQGVPDIGGQPVGHEYDQYPHLYSIYGDHYPRDGKVGYRGKLYGGSEDYHFFKVKLGLKKAGVVYYNQAAAIRFANATRQGLEQEGYQVVMEEVSFALPNFDAAVVDLKSKGVDSLWDVLDEQGNQNLCAKMDSNGLRVKAKVQTVQSWRDTVANYHAPCRNSIYATAKIRNYDSLDVPQVRAYRDAIARYVGDNPIAHAQWGLEGWVGAMWFTDAANSCGANLTRACLEKYMNSVRNYTGHGLTTPRDFAPRDWSKPLTIRNCVSIGQWSDAQKGWLQRADFGRDCYTTHYYSYNA